MDKYKQEIQQTYRTFTNALCKELHSLNLSMTDLKKTRSLLDLHVKNLVVYIFLCKINHISGVIVSLLGSIVVDYGSGPGQVKPKTIKLVFVAFLH